MKGYRNIEREELMLDKIVNKSSVKSTDSEILRLQAASESSGRMKIRPLLS
jgi:hypothetical protein